MKKVCAIDNNYARKNTKSLSRAEIIVEFTVISIKPANYGSFNARGVEAMENREQKPSVLYACLLAHTFSEPFKGHLVHKYILFFILYSEKLTVGKL